MKKDKNNLRLNKFKIAKLTNAKAIVGGDQTTGGTNTNTTDSTLTVTDTGTTTDKSHNC